MQRRGGADGPAVMVRRDGDVVDLREGREFPDLGDAVPRDVGPEYVDQVLAEQVLKHGRASDGAAEAERSDAFAGDLADGAQVGHLTGLVHPQRVHALEGVAQAGGIAGREGGAAIEDEIELRRLRRRAALPPACGCSDESLARVRRGRGTAETTKAR